jgi:hypothetical protein
MVLDGKVINHNHEWMKEMSKTISLLVDVFVVHIFVIETETIALL